MSTLTAILSMEIRLKSISSDQGIGHVGQRSEIRPMNLEVTQFLQLRFQLFPEGFVREACWLLIPVIVDNVPCEDP